MKHISEEDLISLAKKKNESAFLALYNRYREGLKIHLSKLVNPWDIEDICLQTFLKAFLNIERYDKSKGEFRTWLYSIGWNSALDHIGQRKREQSNMPTTSIETSVEGSAASHISAPDKTVDEAMSSQEDYDKLIRYIEGLSDLYRDIAKDRFLEELEYNEIAQRRNLPINTVKTRIKRAKEFLQKMMEEDE